MNARPFLRVIVLLLTTSLEAPAALSAIPSAADFRTPQLTFQAFLQAVKANDLAAAKKCWFISDNNKSGVLDAVVGDWISGHRLNQLARSMFTTEECELLNSKGLLSDTETDDAINRTLARLLNAEVKINCDTATLRIIWNSDDGASSGLPVFLYCGTRPIAKFRRVDGSWKIDAHRKIGFQRPADFFEPHSWFYFYPGYVAITNDLIAKIESGKLRTANEVVKESGRQWAALMEKVAAEKKAKPLNSVEARFFAAWRASLRFTREFYMSRASLWGLYHWSQRLMEAEIERSTSEVQRIAAAEAHLERMEEARYEIRKRAASGRVPTNEYLAMDVYYADAEVQLAKVKGGPVANANPLEPTTSRLAAAHLVLGDHWEKIGREPNGVTPPNKASQLSFFTAFYWLDWCLRAEMAVRSNKTHQRVAIEEYQSRAKQLEDVAEAEFKAGKSSKLVVLEATFHRVDAEILLFNFDAGDGNEKKPLPETAKLGIEAARLAYEGHWAAFQQGRSSTGHPSWATELPYEWSNHWRTAAVRAALANAEQVAATEAHLERMKKLHKLAGEWYQSQRISVSEFWATEFYLKEAEILVSKAKAK